MKCSQCIEKPKNETAGHGASQHYQEPAQDTDVMIETTSKMIVEVEKLKEFIEEKSAPYDQQIAQIEAEMNTATRELAEQDEAICYLLNKEVLELGETLTAGGLMAQFTEAETLDLDAFKKFLDENPELKPELEAQFADIKSVQALQPRTRERQDNAVIVPVEAMTYEQKLRHNQAIMDARALVEKGFVTLDTETTGLGDEDQIVSVSVIRKNGTYQPYYQLVHTNVLMPLEVQEVHGITPEMLADAPEFEEVLPQLQTLIGDKTIVAYNAKFDNRMIEQTARVRGVQPMTNPWVCSMEMFKDFSGNDRWIKLGVAAEAMGIRHEGDLHNAKTDALLAYMLVEAMAKAEPVAVYEPRINMPENATPDSPDYHTHRKAGLEELLAQLSSVREQKNAIAKPYNDRIRAIKKKRDTELAELKARYDELEKTCKENVASLGFTVAGENYQIVPSQRTTWRIPEIIEYAKQNPRSKLGKWVIANIYTKRTVSIKKAPSPKKKK